MGGMFYIAISTVPDGGTMGATKGFRGQKNTIRERDKRKKEKERERERERDREREREGKRNKEK